MPRFSQTSQNRLATCHPDLVALFNEVIKHYDCTILCGHRSREDQDDAVFRGASKTPWPNSKHNSDPSMAVDVGPYFKDRLSWDDSIAHALFAGRVLAIADQLHEHRIMEHRLRWGGDWDMDGENLDQSFNDLVHFELIL